MNLLDENEFYYKVINYIEVMDDILDVNNNSNTDVDWYDAVDISAVRINNIFIQEGFQSLISFMKKIMNIQNQFNL